MCTTQGAARLTRKHLPKYLAAARVAGELVSRSKSWPTTKGKTAGFEDSAPQGGICLQLITVMLHIRADEGKRERCFFHSLLEPVRTGQVADQGRWSPSVGAL